MNPFEQLQQLIKNRVTDAKDAVMQIRNPAHRILALLGARYGADIPFDRKPGVAQRRKLSRIARRSRRLNLRTGF